MSEQRSASTGQRAVERTQREAEQSQRAAMNDRSKILIVDDEPLNLDLLTQELEELDYVTLAAANGRLALEIIASDQPDLVLLDVMMPEMDGFAVLERMKADDRWRDIPVVIVSAMADMGSVVRGIELGADDYLPKPFNPAILNARITAGLTRKRARDLEKLYLQSLQRELEIGHQIQSGFLPQSLPEVSGWELVAHFQAAREVAGDFYDAFYLPDGRIGLFLGDVTDKGVGAALFMALYRSLLRAFLNAESYISCAGGLDDNPEEGPSDYLLRSVCRTNDYVCRTHPNALFATLFSGVLDPASGELVYINAGHNPPLTLEHNRVYGSLPPSGPALGIQEWADFEVRRVNFTPGEALLIYSDGVVDAVNSQGEFFGEGRLRALVGELSGTPQASAAGMVEKIVDSLADFRGEQNPYDDVTLLAVKRSTDSSV